jgi:uncharacterized membrane protein
MSRGREGSVPGIGFELRLSSLRAHGSNFMKVVLLVAGALLLLFGLHWIGQGTGTFVWPANPVMDNHIGWAYFGACAAVAGIILIWYARRRTT